jgi:glycosyltransferase involved in cell wall biosynthesis
MEQGSRLPFVSVVIPVKNGERFLAAATVTVLRQTYTHYEIIMVDGQSEDRTAEIAKSFESVRFIQQSGPGLSNAYNTGIEAAKGEFIAFHAHDDLWTPDKLDTQVRFLLKHPEIQYTIARVKFFLEPGCPVPPGFREELLHNDHVGRILETLVLRRSLFDIVGKFDPELAISMDVDWFARANDLAVPMAIIPRILLHRRVHDANNSLAVQVNNRGFNEEMLGILKRSIHRKQSQDIDRHGKI